MGNVIRIPSEIYSRLEGHAEGFDTPANVIEKLLDHYEGIVHDPTRKSSYKSPQPRDLTKFSFNGKSYGKGKLVQAIVEEYVSNHPEISFSNLLDVFPKHLQGIRGVFIKYEVAQEIFDRTGHKRHYIKSTELIKLSDCMVAVCTQWNKDNIKNFINKSESIGFTITPIRD